MVVVFYDYLIKYTFPYANILWFLVNIWHCAKDVVFDQLGVK